MFINNSFNIVEDTREGILVNVSLNFVTVPKISVYKVVIQFSKFFGRQVKVSMTFTSNFRL